MLGMITNGHGYLVREILKSAVSKEWVYELSCFLHAECEAVSFGLTNIIFYIFYRLLSSSISSFKCQSAAVVLVGPLAVAGRALWYRICPSFLLCVWLFSWNWIIRFLWMLVLENVIKLCVPYFLRKLFLPHKIGEMGQK